jgi:hypothetical protein
MIVAAGPPDPRPQRSRRLPSKRAGSVSADLIGKATMLDTSTRLIGERIRLPLYTWLF